EDYGKTFQDVTHLINHTFVQAEFGLGISPDRSGKLELWLSEDFGATWSKIHDSVCLVRWGPENSIY
ncbi:hypothetical protein CRUP_021594, partial [Coryphaenoides rupestris]